MPSVTFRLPPELHERFLSHCEARDVRPSELLREAIDKLIDLTEADRAVADAQDYGVAFMKGGKRVAPTDVIVMGNHPADLGHHGPKARDRLPSVISGRQLQERMTLPRAPYGSRLKVKK